MTTIGPFLVNPVFDDKPWGGRRLASFGFDLPPGRVIGEALITAPEARIASGPRTGMTLGEMVARDPDGALGVDGLAATAGRPIFALLIKLIDAERPLSIQVHPNDRNAPAGNTGKTEAWHVLRAEPGAVIYVGPKPGVGARELAEAARAGRPMADLLRALPVSAGMTVLLPAGTIHALGGGIVIYEIQQPSGITYRLDDWRVPGDPRPPREMHVEQGLAALDPESRPELTMVSPSPAPIRRLTASAYFTLDRVELASGRSISLPGLNGPRTLTCLSGAARLSTAGGSTEIGSGQTAVLLANEGDLTVSSESGVVLLVGSVPPTL